MQHEELTEMIIGAAYAVYNKIGFGFVESIYENCLIIELNKVKLEAEQQKPITVCYDEEVVGEFKADILVENTVIVELKSVSNLVKAHEVQLVNYLVATGKPVGLLVNFTAKGVEVKRKLPKLD